jgi:FkbM family methyltransferase
MGKNKFLGFLLKYFIKILRSFYKSEVDYQHAVNIIYCRLENISSLFLDEFATMGYTEFQNQYNNLISGLDQTEKMIIDQLVFIQTLNHQLIPFSPATSIRLTPSEIALQTQFESGEETFKFHNGILLLPDIIKQSIQGKDFLDCGGFTGDSAYVFERYYQPKTVYSFEPNPENAIKYMKNIKAFDLQRCKLIQKGVGDKEINLQYLTNKSGSSKIVDTIDAQTDLIEITTIDQFVAKHELQVGLIKMDIENFEPQALIGARETLINQRPVVLISIYHSLKELLGIKPFLESLLSNYVFHIDHLSSTTLNEIELIGYPTELQ